MQKARVVIFTDGASFNNGKKKPDLPQYSTGAMVVTLNEKIIKEEAFDYGDNTISYAELTSVLNSLEFMKKKAIKLQDTYELDVMIISDSEYVIKSFNEYSINWVKNNWRANTGKEVAYKDLWQKIVKYKKNEHFSLTMKHTKGHQKDDSFLTEMNNRADVLCSELLKEKKKELGV